MTVAPNAQLDAYLRDLLSASPDGHELAECKKRVLVHLRDHPELIDEQQEIFHLIDVYEHADPEAVPDEVSQRYRTWLEEHFPREQSSRLVTIASSDSSESLTFSRWWRYGLAAAASVALCFGVWWAATSGPGTSVSAPSVRIVELAPLDTDSWRPFSLERKVLPANHAYRLSPVDVDNTYLAVRDSTGIALTPLSDVAGDNWVVSIHGREGGTASLMFMSKPEDMDDAGFRRAVESRLASIPSTLSVEPGFRLAHATDGTKVERAGGVSLGSPDDPSPPTPQWASDLADQLEADGIQINGWTFPLSEE